MPPTIDQILNGFIDQLFSQRRRSILPGPRGGAIISDPISVDAILRAPEQFSKGYGLLQPLGRNRIGTDGAEWQWRRELTQRHYARAGMAENRDRVGAAYHRRLADCEDMRPESIVRALLAASIEIFHGAFECSVVMEPMLSFFDHARELLKRIQYFSLISPKPAEMAELEQDAQRLLQRYSIEIERSPTLKAWMEGLRLQGQSRSDDFVAAEEFIMNLFAAVETTTATISFAIDRLGAYPALQEAIAVEVFDGDICPKLECFINETMRYYPPIPFLFRKATCDTEIEGLRIKAGSAIIISVIGVHHHPHYWKNPDVFDSGRTEFVEDSYDRRAFIPFSSGTRTCGGTRLARLELTEGLKAFIRRFNVRRRGNEMSFDYTLVLRPNSWDCSEIRKRDKGI